MNRIIIIILRTLQFLAAVANISMSALVVRWYIESTPWPPASIFPFLIFAAVLSLFSVFYLEMAPRIAPKFASPYVLLTIEATNTLFYFAGFIALAVYISHLNFCDGTVCGVARAVSIVAATEFISWIATTILTAKDIFEAGLRGSPTDFDVVPQGLLERQRQQEQQDQQRQQAQQQMQQV